MRPARKRLATGSASAVSLILTAGLTLFVAGISPANARHHRGDGGGERRTEPHNADGPPRLAVIALAQQRVSIYGPNGKFLESPVSTGAAGHETPAGIYSILQKEEEHHSNLYDDASMPYMERLTWTGIAMHAGHVPGYPASHGCTRLPYGFAEQLYQRTEPGLRVVIVREDIVPAEIEQPALFTQGHSSAPDMLSSDVNGSGAQIEAEVRTRLRAIAAAKLAEAQAAERREAEARSFAAHKAAEAAALPRLIQAAEARLAQVEGEAKAIEGSLEKVSGRVKDWDAARANAAAKIETAQMQLEAVKAQAKVKMEAAAQAEDEARTAAQAASEAGGAAEAARQNAWPISIFISRGTQRLYIRRGKDPVYEGPVTIRDPRKMIGTFVFTAMRYTNSPARMSWSVVSMYKNATAIEPYSEVKRELKKQRQAKPADADGARSALNRLVIPQEALDRISSVILPGSSLIISDEGPSKETGKDTDFIVFMSGEPQGGATMRSPPSQEASGERRQGHSQRRRTASSSSRRRFSSSSFFGF